MRLDLEETDAIETESLPNVSSARALFEQMNTKEHQPQQHEQKYNTTRPQMKNWYAVVLSLCIFSPSIFKNSRF